MSMRTLTIYGTILLASAWLGMASAQNATAQPPELPLGTPAPQTCPTPVDQSVLNERDEVAGTKKFIQELKPWIHAPISCPGNLKTDSGAPYTNADYASLLKDQQAALPILESAARQVENSILAGCSNPDVSGDAKYHIQQHYTSTVENIVPVTGLYGHIQNGLVCQFVVFMKPQPSGVQMVGVGLYQILFNPVDGTVVSDQWRSFPASALCQLRAMPGGGIYSSGDSRVTADNSVSLCPPAIMQQ